MRQVAVRTLRRRLRRERLWGVNLEPPLRTLLTDPDHIVRWAWRTHGRTAGRIGWLLTTYPALPVVRLTSRSAVDRWVGGPLASS